MLYVGNVHQRQWTGCTLQVELDTRVAANRRSQASTPRTDGILGTLPYPQPQLHPQFMQPNTGASTRCIHGPGETLQGAENQQLHRL